MKKVILAFVLFAASLMDVPENGMNRMKRILEIPERAERVMSMEHGGEFSRIT